MAGGEPSDRLRLEYRTDDSVAIVDVDGEIDLFTCGLLRDRLLALADEGHTSLVVNLGSVSFIDSTGLGVLVGVWHRLSPADWRAGPGGAIGRSPRPIRDHRSEQAFLDLREHG